ncbi:hypothetical protein [Vulcanisaeta souniana]|uniref:hypothetical protein n=1 Tax=Vulcanisaeta souniana TaxID=164452 RepID=UPI000AEF7932|nr:hypothetical protein [Vulcanisaeta souniana]
MGGACSRKTTKLEGPARDNFEKLLRSGAIDSACINYAKNKRIDQELTKIGIKLHPPAGDRVAYYINNGYQVLVF